MTELIRYDREWGSIEIKCSISELVAETYDRKFKVGACGPQSVGRNWLKFPLFIETVILHSAVYVSRSCK